jgi:hypothetical protein
MYTIIVTKCCTETSVQLFEHDALYFCGVLKQGDQDLVKAMPEYVELSQCVSRLCCFTEGN